MKLVQNVIIFSVLSAMASSCGLKETELHEVDAVAVPAADTTAVTYDDTTKFKFDFTLANIPSPANTMQELASWHVAYDNSILNSPQAAGNYATEFKRSLNLGVYNIDMAYAMMNNKGPDVLAYMKSILQVSDALGLKNTVNAMIGKRAEANLNNKDSLFTILDDIFLKSDNYLRTNERVYTASAVFAGSWIENLYLSSKIGALATDEKSKMLVRKHLLEQRFHLSNLVNLLSDYKAKKECADLLASLKPILEEFTALHEVSEMNDEKFASITGKIIALRTSVVE
jgi:hypothetical protein